MAHDQRSRLEPRRGAERRPGRSARRLAEEHPVRGEQLDVAQGLPAHPPEGRQGGHSGPKGAGQGGPTGQSRQPAGHGQPFNHDGSTRIALRRCRRRGRSGRFNEGRRGHKKGHADDDGGARQHSRRGWSRRARRTRRPISAVRPSRRKVGEPSRQPERRGTTERRRHEGPGSPAHADNHALRETATTSGRSRAGR